MNFSAELLAEILVERKQIQDQLKGHEMHIMFLFIPIFFDSMREAILISRGIDFKSFIVLPLAQ